MDGEKVIKSISISQQWRTTADEERSTNEALEMQLLREKTR
jgi:hypothetical protein